MKDTQTTQRAIINLSLAQKRHLSMNSVSHKFMLRNEVKNSKGMAPLCMKLFVNGEKLVISLNQMLFPDDWDHKKQQVKPSNPSHKEINSILADAATRKIRIIANANMSNVALNKSLFKQMFSIDSEYNDFVSWAIDDANKRLGNIDKSTLNAQLAVLNKLKSFRKKIPFNDFTTQTLEAFEKYMTKKGNNINTRHNAMKTLKTYVARALRNGIIFANPFQNYKLKKGESQRTFLDEIELQKLLSIYDESILPPKLKSSLLFYLLSAFTSLRISDVKKLTPEDLEKNAIKIKPYKTRKYEKIVEIPLTIVSQRLLKEAFSFKGRMKSEQKINDDLKLIASYAEINKRITFHTARHTFATTFLTLGGKVETLQQILGHTNIATTMIYVHITDHRKEEEMKNFDKHFQ
jgi:site-specific recombinase XerD